MNIWQIQEVNLMQLLNEAKREPQFISCHGVKEVVVISIEKYQQLMNEQEDIVMFFRNSPLNGLDLEFKRDPSDIREID